MYIYSCLCLPIPTMLTIFPHYQIMVHYTTPRETYRCIVIALKSIKSTFKTIPHSALCQVADGASVLWARVRWRFCAGFARVRRHAGDYHSDAYNIYAIMRLAPPAI